MNYIKYRKFPEVLAAMNGIMKSADRVPQSRWQGIDVSKDPAAACYEVTGVEFEVDLDGVEDLDHWRGQIGPNLPWADDHFAERVGGQPLNPGVEWRNWPWGKSAARFRDEDEQFNHTYMERFWPKYAGMFPRGEIQDPMFSTPGLRGWPWVAHRGIRNEYGDLNDLVDLLCRDPYTRQAWIPLFFPEDTGWGDGGRKPCTLGYQFLVRNDRISVWYPLRSCDLVRHLRDDCYLAVRLLLWILDRCRSIDWEFWGRITTGTYSMHVTSLHVFENDMRDLRRTDG